MAGAASTQARRNSPSSPQRRSAAAPAIHRATFPARCTAAPQKVRRTIGQILRQRRRRASFFRGGIFADGPRARIAWSESSFSTGRQAFAKELGKTLCCALQGSAAPGRKIPARHGRQRRLPTAEKGMRSAPRPRAPAGCAPHRARAACYWDRSPADYTTPRDAPGKDIIVIADPNLRAGQRGAGDFIRAHAGLRAETPRFFHREV